MTTATEDYTRVKPGLRSPAQSRRASRLDEDARSVGDGELVDLVLQGDRAAFAILYQRHASLVARVVGTHFGTPDVVADLVQETFARALAGLRNLRDPCRFQAWLCSIARHVAIDHRRSRRRQVSLDEIAEPASIEPAQDDAAELNELAGLVRECVVGLSARDATAIGLATRFELSTAELGRALGVTPGTGKVILHRARRRLRMALVLELLVRRHASGCAHFAELFEAGATIAATGHARQCLVCQERALASSTR